MKKIVVLPLLVISMHLFAQSYPIVPVIIVLPSDPDANTANWGSGTSIFSITASTKLVNGKIDSRVTASRILTTIKSGGSKICSVYTSNTAPASNFNEVTKVWRGNNAVALLGKGCVLPPGDYEVCVQFFANDAKAVTPLSEEIHRSFSIKGKGR